MLVSFAANVPLALHFGPTKDPHGLVPRAVAHAPLGLLTGAFASLLIGASREWPSPSMRSAAMGVAFIPLAPSFWFAALAIYSYLR